MDKQYYEDQMRQQVELMNQSSEKQESFFQQILIVSAGILGILISLHTNNSTDQCIRLVFVLATVLLALGTLTVAIVVYDYSRLVERTRQAHISALAKALREKVEVGSIAVPLKKRTKFCIKVACSSLVLSLIVLTLYVVLSNI